MTDFTNPKVGATLVVDGVTFTYDPSGGYSGQPVWGAGALAEKVYINADRYHKDVGYYWHVGARNFKDIQRAMRAAINNRKWDVKKARELIASYEAAVAEAAGIPMVEVDGPVESPKPMNPASKVYPSLNEDVAYHSTGAFGPKDI
jgi:hypothetical protein